MGINNRGKLGGAFVMLAGLACTAFGQVEEEWTKLTHHTESGESFWLIGLGASGDLYMTGSREDALVVGRFDPDGNLIWERTYTVMERPGGGWGAIDNDENLYISGSTGRNYNTDPDATVKIDSDGNVLWSVVHEHPLFFLIAPKMELDASGNVYLSGRFSTRSADWDILTKKYDTDGTLLWSRIFDNGVLDTIASMVVDGSGNVFITGSTIVGNNTDILILKYDTFGSLVWSRTYDFDPSSSSHNGDVGYDIALDFAGNVIVVGYSDTGTSGEGDFTTLKYTPDGTLVWVRQYNNPVSNVAWATRVATDSTGAVFVSGKTLSLAGQLEILTVKYDVNGVEQWARTHGGSGDGSDTPAELTVDSDDNLYLVGNVIGAGDLKESLVLKYDSDGNVLWIETSTGIGAGRHASAWGLTLGAGSSIYVTGIASATASSNKISSLTKYSQTDLTLPTGLSILRGMQTGGGLGVLFASDDDRLTVRAGITLFSGEAPIQVEVTGTADTETPSELRFKLEASANTPNLGQKIEMYNYVKSQYEEVDFWIASPSDSVVEVVISTNAARFIKPGTKEMKTKVSYYAVGITLFWPWTASIDQATWTVIP